MDVFTFHRWFYISCQICLIHISQCLHIILLCLHISQKCICIMSSYFTNVFIFHKCLHTYLHISQMSSYFSHVFTFHISLHISLMSSHFMLCLPMSHNSTTSRFTDVFIVHSYLHISQMYLHLVHVFTFQMSSHFTDIFTSYILCLHNSHMFSYPTYIFTYYIAIVSCKINEEIMFVDDKVILISITMANDG